jgi:hypothetical protein
MAMRVIRVPMRVVMGLEGFGGGGSHSMNPLSYFA